MVAELTRAWARHDPRSGATACGPSGTDMRSPPIPSSSCWSSVLVIAARRVTADAESDRSRLPSRCHADRLRQARVGPPSLPSHPSLLKTRRSSELTSEQCLGITDLRDALRTPVDDAHTTGRDDGSSLPRRNYTARVGCGKDPLQLKLRCSAPRVGQHRTEVPNDQLPRHVARS